MLTLNRNVLEIVFVDSTISFIYHFTTYKLQIMVNHENESQNIFFLGSYFPNERIFKHVGRPLHRANQ